MLNLFQGLTALDFGVSSVERNDISFLRNSQYFKNNIIKTLPLQEDAKNAASKFLFLMKTPGSELRPQKAQVQSISPEAIRSMEEELRFWKMETSVLLRLLQQLEYRGHNTKVSLKVLKEESVFLLENTFTDHEAKLNTIRGRKVIGRIRFKSLERSHQKIRKAYQKFKLKVLWVLPSFVPITIW